MSRAAFKLSWLPSEYMRQVTLVAFVFEMEWFDPLSEESWWQCLKAFLIRMNTLSSVVFLNVGVSTS